MQRPVLYTLAAVLVDARTNTTADAINITIGLRHIDWRAPGGGFALNGKPLHLRGFSHHQGATKKKEKTKSLERAPLH